MTRPPISGAVGAPLAVLGLAQVLQYARLIDSPYVAETLVFPVAGLEGLFLAAMLFLLGILLLAGGLTTDPAR